MFCLRVPRRALTATLAAAAVIHETSKLPIYPSPVPEIVLQETPSELEKQIGATRRAVTARYYDAYGQVQGVVSRWIGIEQAVEMRVKSIIAPDEPLTPGILYVGVATLTGSVLARNRLLFWRLLLPPTLLAVSLNHFLPKTSHNLAQYLGSLEDTYFPTFSEKHEIAKQHSAMTWERAKVAALQGREQAFNGVVGTVERLERASGLKLRETLGWGKAAVASADARVSEASHAIEKKAEATIASAQETVGEVKDAIVEKVEEIKRLV